MTDFGWKASETEIKVDSTMQSVEESNELLFKELVGIIDQDGNGIITFNEFVWFSEK